MTALGARLLPLCLLAAAAPAAALEHAVLRSERAAVVEMRTAALIMSGQEGGALPIALGVVPLGGVAATAMVEIDGAALLAAAPGAGTLGVEVFAYVLGEDLDVLAHAAFVFEVDPERHRGLLAATGLKVFLPLDLPAGNAMLRVLARAGEAFGLRSLALGAGAAGGRAQVLPPVFHERPQPWLLALAGGADLPPPFGFDGSAPLPASGPLSAPGEVLAGHLFVRGPGAADAGLRALLRGPGEENLEAPLEIVGRADDDDLTALAFTLAVPDLAPGSYTVAVAFEGPDAEAPRSGFVPLFIAAGDSPAFAEDAAASPAGEGAAAAEPLSRAQKKLLRAVTEGYLRALRQLAAGERRTALAILEASESRVVAALDAGAVPLLEQGQSRLLAALPDDGWGSVLPAILLHVDAGRSYRRDRRPFLAHHATRMATGLAASYARKLATPAAAREAAMAVSSLAGYLQEGGTLSHAERLFRQALSLDGDPAALLGLATILEKRGRFDAAVPPLADFVAARPDHSEGALRLALNRYRSGDAGRARATLERLASGAGTGWVELLAHQELARLEMDAGRLAAAAEVLRRGLERWPGHPTLTVQLAWVLDAGGEPVAAQGLVTGLDLAAAPEPSGERSRYNRWPEDLLEAGRRELAALAAGRLDDLGRRLEDLASILHQPERGQRKDGPLSERARAGEASRQQEAE